MAFQAGAINVGALLSCHKFVTHTTGLLTTFGAEFALGNWINAIGFAIIPLFFLIGAMTSAYFIDHRIQTDKRPLYPVVMGVSFLILAMVVIGGKFGTFGQFGSELDMLKHFALLIGLAFTSGLINATVTSACGAVIRITHMTGLTTDLGIGLMRVFTRTHKINTRENEIRANLNRILIITSFAIGAGVSAIAFGKMGYGGFIIPCGLALLLFNWSVIRFTNSKIFLPFKSVLPKEMISNK
jgi:uncharacterized membrane protein YoaK (UPF0700 family)